MEASKPLRTTAGGGVVYRVPGRPSPVVDPAQNRGTRPPSSPPSVSEVGGRTGDEGGAALSPEEFRARVDEAHGLLLRFACRRTRCFHDAEDLVQDTVERALGRRHLYRDDKNLLGWLTRIMSNVHVSRLKSAQNDLTTSLADVDHFAASEPAPRSWLDELGTEDVCRVLPRLSPVLREAFEAFHLQRLDQAEIARRQGVKRSTVGVRIFRARRQIAELLRADKEQPE